MDGCLCQLYLAKSSLHVNDLLTIILLKGARKQQEPNTGARFKVHFDSDKERKEKIPFCMRRFSEMRQAQIFLLPCVVFLCSYRVKVPVQCCLLPPTYPRFRKSHTYHAIACIPYLQRTEVMSRKMADF